MMFLSKTFPTAAFTGFLAGPVGKLQIATTWPQVPVKAVAIICHPHPLHGGTMNNKVVTILSKTCDELGLATIRFNFRGVGDSAGKYGNATGEIDDLLAVHDWVKSVLPKLPVWLAGFSFGSFIAANVANQKPVARLITVAPAVNHFDYSTLTHINCPWLVVAAESDEIVPYSSIQEFVAHPPASLELVTVAESSHFFHGKLINLRELIKSKVAV